VGYVEGDLCLQEQFSGGSGFHGTFHVDSSNGTLLSLSIINHGMNYTEDPGPIGLCFNGSAVLQVGKGHPQTVHMLCSRVFLQEHSITKIEVLSDADGV
jgi:hypothetical protein